MSFKSKYTGALIEALLDNANYIQDMLLPKIEGYVTSIELKDGKITVTVQKELTSENIKYLDKPLEDVINELIERSGLLDKVVANSLNVVYDKFNEYVPKSGGLFGGNIGADKFIKTGSNSKEVLLGSGEAKEVFDNSGKIKSDYLPSYVDDVLEFTSRSAFPALGESGKIYVSANTGLTYRWSGSTYISISSRPDWYISDPNSLNYIKNRTHYLDNVNQLSTSYEGQFECRVVYRDHSIAEFCMGVIAYSGRTTLEVGDKYYVELYGYRGILTYDGDTLHNSKSGAVTIHSPHILTGKLMGLLVLYSSELVSLVGMNDQLRIKICEFDGIRELDEIYIPTTIKNQINNNKSKIGVNTSNIQKVIDIQDLSHKYFYIDTGTTSGSITNPNALLLYSDDGIGWSSVSKNDKVSIKGKKYVRYNGKFSGPYSLGTFKVDVSFTIGGNILSLISSSADNYNVEQSFNALFKNCTSITSAADLIIPKDIVMGEYAFLSMFAGCTSLKYPPKLSMLNLGDYCYRCMFINCDSLLEAPELPATVLYQGCYLSMFEACGSLKKAPELPALSVPIKGYEAMFKGCTELEAAPELPATFVDAGGYYAMFSGCDILTKGPSVLPAKSVIADTYQYMFANCDLTETPIILAESIHDQDYSYHPLALMFQNNKNLKKVTILATDFGGDDHNPCYKWLSGCSSSGTFIKHPNATWSTGDSGIPSKWEVVNYYPLEEIDNVKKEINTTKSDLLRLINKVDSKIVLSDWNINAEANNAYIKNRTHYLKNTKYIGKSFKLLWQGSEQAYANEATDISGEIAVYPDGQFFEIDDSKNQWLSIFEEGKIYRIGISTGGYAYDEEFYPGSGPHDFDDYDVITGKFQKIVHPHTGKEIFVLGDLNNAFIAKYAGSYTYALAPNLNSREKFILLLVEYNGDSYFSLLGDCSISEELERLGSGWNMSVDVVIEEVTDYDIEYEYKQLDINYIPTVNTLDESTDKVPTSKAVYDKITEVASQAKYTSNIEDKTLTMPNAVGGIAKGTTVSTLEGKTYNEIFDDLLFPTVNPTFTAPSSTIALRDKNASVLEIGVQGPSISDFTTSFNAGAINLNGVKQNNRAGALDADSSFIYIDGDAADVLTDNPYEFNVGNNTFTYRAYYAEGPQPKDNKGNDYSTPLAAGYVDSKAVTVSGTYPWYASTATATSDNPVVKQALVAWNNTAGSMSTGLFTVQPSGTLPQVFKLPRQLKTLQMLNAVSGAMDTIGTSDYTETTEVITIGSTNVTYYVYTYNGSTRGEVTLLAKF